MPRPARRFPVSEELARVLRLLAERGAPRPDRPTPAAAVVLLRDADGGPEVFVTRQSGARGNRDRNRWSFPQAELSPADLRRLPLAGWDAARCARTLGVVDHGWALSAYAAAARAALQLTGVLLAEDAGGRVVSAEPDPELAPVRAQLHDGRTALPRVLNDRNLRFRPDLLHPWLRWINTEWQLRRFDTVYFTAVVPPSDELDFASPDDGWGGWLRPADVIARVDGIGPSRSDELSVAARLVCESLDRLPSAGAAMAAVRDLRPFEPRIEREDDAWSVVVDDLPARSAGRVVTAPSPRDAGDEERMCLVDDDAQAGAGAEADADAGQGGGRDDDRSIEGSGR